VCGATGYFGTVAFTNQYNQTMEENKTGQTASWSDPDGKSYSVTPTETYYVDEQPCRKFRQTVEINGQVEILSGTACRQADGTWKLTS
jgi:surface antigen